MAKSHDQLTLVWANPHQPIRRWVGIDPMQPAVVTYERQAQILAQRTERITWLPQREQWWC
jgi:hypothetical protein